MSSHSDCESHAEYGSKTIGLMGSVMLLINNLAGPTVVLMPTLAQEAGWLSMIVVMILLALVSGFCGYLLLSAMRAIEDNGDFGRRIEFVDIVRYYLPGHCSLVFMSCYYLYLMMTLMSYLVSTAQVLDFASLHLFGCAYGFEVVPSFGGVCGTEKDSSTPFGSVTVLPLSFLAVAAFCAPFGLKNLDDNVNLQILAIFGFTFIVIVWMRHFSQRIASEGLYSIPVWSWSQTNLWGTLLFNFALMGTLPSWVNEKKGSVSVRWSFVLTMSYVVVVYSAIGIVGGMAYPPYFKTDENLFTKLDEAGGLPRLTVVLYPLLQNFTSIPVFCVLIRYNLMHSGLGVCCANFISLVLPWILSIFFYTGSGFMTLSVIGGLISSSVVNFLIPAVVFAAAWYDGHVDTLEALTDDDEEDARCHSSCDSEE